MYTSAVWTLRKVQNVMTKIAKTESSDSPNAATATSSGNSAAAVEARIVPIRGRWGHIHPGPCDAEPWRGSVTETCSRGR